MTGRDALRRHRLGGGRRNTRHHSCEPSYYTAPTSGGPPRIRKHGRSQRACSGNPPPFGARTRQARLLRSKNPATPAMWLNGPCVCTRTVQSTGDFSMGCTKGASHQLSQNPAITGLSTVNVCALNKGTTQWRKHTSARKADVSCADRAATRGYSHHAREPQT